jgi:hypothetical protein
MGGIMSTRLNNKARRKFRNEIIRPQIKMIARIILVPTITAVVLFIIYTLE